MTPSKNITIPPWYKPSPLGPIPNDWKVEEMKNITTLITNGFVWKATDYYVEEDGILYIQGYNAQENGFDFHWVKYVSREFHEQHKKSILREWDLLTIQTWDVGVTAYVTKELEGANCHALIISRYIDTVADSRFYHQFFNSPLGRKFLKIIETGSTMKHLNCGDMESLKLPVPPVNEQTAIANLLSTWDEAISKVSKLIEQHGNRKIWVMRELLTGRKRLSWFSVEWKRQRLGDIFERVTRKNEEKNTNVLTISAQRWLINQENFFNKQIASELLDNYFLLYKNEFAYNKSYSNGYPMWAIKRLNDYEKWVVTTLYICFRLKSELGYNHDFFEQYFENGLLIKSLEKIAHEWWRAHGLLNVTPSDFFNIEISTPEIEEQNRIAEILMRSDQEIQLLKSKLEKLKEQKEWLMQQLLTGKKRLKF